MPGGAYHIEVSLTLLHGTSITRVRGASWLPLFRTIGSRAGLPCGPTTPPNRATAGVASGLSCRRPRGTPASCLKSHTNFPPGSGEQLRGSSSVAITPAPPAKLVPMNQHCASQHLQSLLAAIQEIVDEAGVQSDLRSDFEATLN